MGLSRNKVAVPEGAAGTPPFWSVWAKAQASANTLKAGTAFRFVTPWLLYYAFCFLIEKDEAGQRHPL